MKNIAIMKNITSGSKSQIVNRKPLARRSQLSIGKKLSIAHYPLSIINCTLLIVFCLFFGGKALGQTSLTVCDGTTTNSYVPFYGYMGDAAQHNQMIYPASDLTNMVGKEIIQMAFHVSSGSTTLNNWTISLGETTATTLSSLDQTTSLTQVYSGSLVTTNGVMTIVFDNGYVYNGGNLLVDFNHPASNWGSYSFYGITATSAAYTYSSVRNFLPKNTFTYQNPPSCPKPTGLTVALTQGNGTVANLSWTAGGTETNWTVEYADNSSFTNPQTQSVSNTPSTQLTGLTPETTYYARVIAVCGVGDESEPSNEVTFTPTNSFTATVNNCTNTNSYAPLYGNYKGSYDQMIYTADQLESAGIIGPCTITRIGFNSSASNGILRLPVIYICHSDKSSFSSNSDFVSINEFTKVYDYNNHTTWSITEGWNEFVLDEPFDYDGSSNLIIAVHCAIASNYSSTYFYTAETNNNQVIYAYSDSNNPDPNTYEGNWGSYSSRGVSKNLPCLELYYEPTVVSCAKPTGLAAGTPGPRSVQLSWTAGGSETAWQICVNGNESNPTLVSENPYTLEGLTPETTYTVKVRAYCDASDQSNWSNEISFTTDVACPTPSDVAAPSQSITEKSARIVWTENGSAENWVVQYSLNSDLSGATSINVPDNTRVTINGLAVETTYYVRVKAVCGGIDGESGWSEIINFTTAPCPVPTDLEATNMTPTGTTLIWTGSGEDYVVMLNEAIENINFETGDLSQASFTNDATYPFTVVQIDDNFVVMSGNGGQSSQTSSLELSVNSTSTITISFRAKVSSESNYDKAYFSIDGNEQDGLNGISGDGEWITYTYTLTAGSHTLRWYYTKDSSVDGGDDCFYVDDIIMFSDNWTENSVSGNSYDIDGLSLGVTYLAMVKYDCGNGIESDPSDILQFELESCPTPRNVTVTDINARDASVAWDGYGDSYVVMVNESLLNANFETGDLSQASFTNDATYPFEIVEKDGSFVAKSTCEGESSGISYIELAVNYNSPVTISFRAKVSSESGWDKAYFSIDGNEQDGLNGISGAGAWKDYSYDIAVGSHTLRWYYQKDPSVNSNEDCFYIDDIAIFSSTWTEYTDVTDNPYTLGGLTPETAYLVRVQGVCVDEDSKPSKITTFTTDEACHRPTNLTVGMVSASVAVLSWESDADNWQYECVAHGNDPTWSNPQSTNSRTNVPVTIPNASPNTEYDIYVRAYCGGADYSHPVMITVTTGLCEMEDMCEISYRLEDSNYDGWNGAAINVVDDETDIVLATLTIGTGEGLVTGVLPVCKDRDLNFVWVSGSYDSQCSYEVFDAEGTTIFVGSGSLTTQTYTVECPSCLRPTRIAASSVTASSAVITWSANNGETSWDFMYRVADADTWNTENSISANPYTLTGLLGGTNYEVKIVANCTVNDQSAESEVYTFGTLCDDQIDITTASTSTSTYLPTYSYYAYSLTQQIYTADEIGDGDRVLIRGISFYNGGTARKRDVDIYMVYTNKSSFSSGTDWIPVTAADKVYTGGSSVAIVKNGWTRFFFDSPFSYDGIHNIAVIVDDNTGTGQSGVAGRVFDTDGYQAIYIYGSTNYNPTSMSSSGYRTTSKNQVIFCVTPITAEVTSEVPAVCQEAEVELTANTAGFISPVYEWTAVPSEGAGLISSNSSTITVTPTGSGDYTYKCKVTESGKSTFISSNVDLTVNEKPSVSFAGPTTVCAGKPETISVSGAGVGGSYIWDNGLGTGAEKTIYISENTDYTVVALNTDGCTANGTHSISVNIPGNLPSTYSPEPGIIWTGYESTDWDDQRNWLFFNGDNYTPIVEDLDSTLSVVLRTGGTEQCILHDPVINNPEFDANAGMTVRRNITVANGTELNIGGALTLEGGTLTLGGSTYLAVGDTVLIADGASVSFSASDTLLVSGNFTLSGNINFVDQGLTDNEDAVDDPTDALVIGGDLTINGASTFSPAGGSIVFARNSGNRRVYNNTGRPLEFFKVELDDERTRSGVPHTVFPDGTIIKYTAIFSYGIWDGDLIFAKTGNALVKGGFESYASGNITKIGKNKSFSFPTGGNDVLGSIAAKIPTDVQVSAKFNSKTGGYDQEHDGYPRWWNNNDMCDDSKDLNHVSNYEYWTVRANTATTLTDLTFTAEAADRSSHFNPESSDNEDVNEEAIRLAMYNGCWKNLGGADNVTVDDGKIEIEIPALSLVASGAKGIADDPIITLGSTTKTTILPIELTSFTATCDGRSTLVEWSTASEGNNDYFSLERSDDAINFTEIARVAGAGNSIEPLDYSYTDYGIHGGDNYYRLVQVDYDGTRTVSEIVVANCVDAVAEDPEVMAYPNPFSGELTLVLDNFDNRAATIEVYDMLGKLIYTEKASAPQNSYETILNLSNLPSGAYTVRVSTTAFVINKNVVKN